MQPWPSRDLANRQYKLRQYPGGYKKQFETVLSDGPHWNRPERSAHKEPWQQIARNECPARLSCSGGKCWLIPSRAPHASLVRLLRLDHPHLPMRSARILLWREDGAARFAYAFTVVAGRRYSIAPRWVFCGSKRKTSATDAAPDIVCRNASSDDMAHTRANAELPRTGKAIFAVAMKTHAIAPSCGFENGGERPGWQRNCPACASHCPAPPIRIVNHAINPLQTAVPDGRSAGCPRVCSPFWRVSNR